MSGTNSSTLRFAERISAHSAKLTEVDRKLAEALATGGYEALFLSAGALCERIGVHEAAATRLAQRLGYSGYPNLRRALQEEQLGQENGASRMRRSVEATGGGDYLKHHIESEVRALEEILQYVAQNDLNTVADRIAASSRIFIFSQGHAYTVGLFLKKRLDRFGLTTISLTGRGREIAERAVSINDTDLVIAFAFRKQPSGYEPLLRYAANRGTFTVAVSDLIGSKIAPQPDLLIAAPRGRVRQEFQTPSVPLAIISAILLTIAGRHDKRMIGALEEITSLFNSFDEEKN